MLYIAEAHATDEWPISSGRYTPDGQPVSVLQPKTAADRIGQCGAFLKAYGLEGAEGMRVAVDDPEGGDDFQRLFAPWPIRLYVIEGGKMEFISEPTNCSHDVGALREWLDNRFK